MHNFYIIKWGRDYFDNYNYGAEIKFEADDSVAFSAPFMPTGDVIKSWTSKTQFQIHRKTPLLPLLTSGNLYRFKIVATADHSVAMQVRIEFLDVSGSVILEKSFSDLAGQFEFPTNAVSYRLNLLNNHHQQICFNYLLIYDIALHDKFEIEIDLKHNLVCFRDHEAIKKNRIVILKQSEDVNCFTVAASGNQYFVLSKAKGTDFISQIQQLYRLIQVDWTADAIYQIEKGISFLLLEMEYQLLPDILKLLLANVSFTNIDPKTEAMALQIIEKRMLINELACDILEEFVSVSK
ncbi:MULTISPECIES: accessory Sec system protein Asp3 [unclassified Enterococcus]|uniref:accessory Sec system protein Asp3 n=1 Tax=unclassified Enterococcus TaxID=2608891 RepID=UPI0015567364|nr:MULTISPECIES: accessory Sec system protein Asp3 [unclassified Enterococcus]MBS7576336.1 accessory Sec system protein Asp3 [Enterococcus sp. MMGLQ5-2]MBS7583568.1 accessory Sec system protein Asp3 [Enterococcus sp. MMGLQ5-1]NPD11430.1 accessory Sec system protein Asp3 [Enterococcus sp. MMGLQ5-1]NPD36174.1 accessory Sec system protein Asp3 [Enterococcus sp. MMGLQ5-2]